MPCAPLYSLLVVTSHPRSFSPPLSLFSVSPLQLLHGVVVASIEVIFSHVSCHGFRLALCDLGDPGWGDPWFPHSAVLLHSLDGMAL